MSTEWQATAIALVGSITMVYFDVAIEIFFVNILEGLWNCELNFIYLYFKILFEAKLREKKIVTMARTHHYE